MTGSGHSRLRLGWADHDTREEVCARLRELGRQTMNLRVMTSAKVLELREVDTRKLVGFCGMDDEYLPAYPELFSLHVEEEYRHYHMGTVLQTARAGYLLGRGHRMGYTRMDETSNAGLLEYRLRTEAFSRLPPEELARSYVRLCDDCELHGASCKKQAYLITDLASLYERGMKRLGPINLVDLPIEVAVEVLNSSHSTREVEK